MTIVVRLLRHLVFLLLLAPDMTGRAQYISSGYIVKAPGDTVRGFIREDSDENLLGRISFSKDGSVFQVYNVYQIDGFGFDYGRTFKLFELPFARDMTRFFGKRLVVGKLNLYSVGSAGFVFTSDTLHTLIRPPVSREVATKNGMLHRTKDKEYISIMNELMQDAPPENLDKVKFTAAQIAAVTEKYNAVFADKYPAGRYMARRKTNLVAYGGYGPSSEGNASQFCISLEYEAPERTNFLSGQSSIVYYNWKWEYAGPPQGKFVTRQNYIGIYPIGVTLQTAPAKVRAYVKFDIGLLAFTTTTFRSYGYDSYTGQYVLTPEQDVSNIKWLFFNGAAGLRVALGQKSLLADVSRVFGNSDLQKNVMFNLGVALPISDSGGK